MPIAELVLAHLKVIAWEDLAHDAEPVVALSETLDASTVLRELRSLASNIFARELVPRSLRYDSSVHAIRAVIGTPATLEALRGALPSARIVDLPQRLALLPAVPTVMAEAGAGEQVSGFYGLTSSMRQLLERASEHGPLVYVETEYFGGLGGQAALVISEGRTQSLESTLEDEACGDDPTPISTALREIGVARGDALDEFDAIGLGRHRSTWRWHERGR